MVGQVFNPWGVDMFWDAPLCSEGDGDRVRNTGGEARAQPPILPCPGTGDFRMGVHAGKGVGGDTS